MTKTRRSFSSQQAAEIVSRHLKDKVAISSLAEELAMKPTQIYPWVASDRPQPIAAILGSVIAR